MRQFDIGHLNENMFCALSVSTNMFCKRLNNLINVQLSHTGIKRVFLVRYVKQYLIKLGLNGVKVFF